MVNASFRVCGLDSDCDEDRPCIEVAYSRRYEMNRYVFISLIVSQPLGLEMHATPSRPWETDNCYSPSFTWRARVHLVVPGTPSPQPEANRTSRLDMICCGTDL